MQSLQRLVELREERKEEREAELARLELVVAEQRCGYQADRKFFNHWASAARVGAINEEARSAAAERALGTQATLRANLMANLQRSREELSSQHAAIYATRNNVVNLRREVQQLHRQSTAEIAALRMQLQRDDLGCRACEARAVQLREELDSERVEHNAEAQAARASKRVLEDVEATTAAMHDKMIAQSERVTQIVSEVKHEAMSQRQLVKHRQVIQEADEMRRLADVQDFEKRSLARRYAESGGHCQRAAQVHGALGGGVQDPLYRIGRAPWGGAVSALREL